MQKEIKALICKENQHKGM